MIVSCGFSQFLHFFCYQGQGIHCWHSYWATMFEWPWKFKSNSGSRSILVILSHKFSKFFIQFMFLKSGYLLLIFLRRYHAWVTSKIQVDFRFNRYSEVLVNVSCRFLIFLHFLCFWGQGILGWHSFWTTIFGGLRKFRPTSEVFEVKHPNIHLFTKKYSKFISSRAKVAGRSHDQRFIANWTFTTRN